MTVRELEREDGSWLSALDASRWLHHVSQCLKLAVYICGIMVPDRAVGMNVILKGEKGIQYSPSNTATPFAGNYGHIIEVAFDDREN